MEYPDPRETAKTIMGAYYLIGGLAIVAFLVGAAVLVWRLALNA